MAKKFVVELESVTPILFGRQYSGEVPKQSKESDADYEARTWRSRLHVNEKNNVVIPPLAIKNLLRDVAKYVGEKIPGKGKATYTKHFRSGVMVFDSMVLKDKNGKPIAAEKVQPLWLSVPSDGMTGGTKRVAKAFPQIEYWQGQVEVVVLDENISEDVLKRHLTEGGNFIGLGSMRVGNGGITGRFKIAEMREVRA